MLRSMYSAISGLKNFQTKLDVIGNNIANVSTYGFKKGRTTFQDLISQQISGASAPTFARGGVNPKQVGLGSETASIDNIMTQGNLQTTGRALDMAVAGDGYFIVQDGFNKYYTRAGNFYMDSEGALVTSSGLRLMGYGVDPKTGVINTGKLVNLKISNDMVEQKTTDSLTVTGNFNITDFMDNDGNLKTDTKKLGFTIFDPSGKSHKATITFSASNTADIDENDLEKGKYVNEMSFTINVPDETGNPAPHTGKVTFKPDGTVDKVTIDGDGPMDFQFDGGKVSIKSDAFDFDTLTMQKTPDTADVVGDVLTMDSFSVGSSGEIYGVLSDGSVQLLGQVVLSQFSNPEGLEKAGSGLFKATANSGNPVIFRPGENGSSINPGALEMSNVDLSEEFTSMIEAQRGFQANARVITTADQILQELVSLKR